MKKLLLVTLTIFLVKSISAQFSLDHYHPIDIIKSEGIDTCTIYVLQSDSSSVIEQSYIFNSKGLEIGNRRDFQQFSFVYKFNEEGLKTAEYLIPFGEMFFERDTFFYDKNDRLIQRITYSQDGTESKRNEYDYNENLIYEDRYILEGALQLRSLYKYDKKGKLYKIELYFRGVHHEDWVHEYDSNGNLISFITISPKGDTTLLHKFEYNEKGLRIKHTIYDSGNNLSTIFLTTYDSKGLISYMEAITGIKNNDPKTGEYEKTIYKYSYR